MNNDVIEKNIRITLIRIMKFQNKFRSVKTKSWYKFSEENYPELNLTKYWR